MQDRTDSRAQLPQLESTGKPFGAGPKILWWFMREIPYQLASHGVNCVSCTDISGS
jgi:hypothetical protein